VYSKLNSAYRSRFPRRGLSIYRKRINSMNNFNQCQGHTSVTVAYLDSGQKKVRYTVCPLDDDCPRVCYLRCRSRMSVSTIPSQKRTHSTRVLMPSFILSFFLVLLFLLSPFRAYSIRETLRFNFFLVGRTHWTGNSPSQGRYQTQNKHIHALSGIGTHDLSV
jgi:hypothetical protein